MFSADAPAAAMDPHAESPGVPGATQQTAPANESLHAESPHAESPHAESPHAAADGDQTATPVPAAAAAVSQILRRDSGTGSDSDSELLTMPRSATALARPRQPAQMGGQPAQVGGPMQLRASVEPCTESPAAPLDLNLIEEELKPDKGGDVDWVHGCYVPLPEGAAAVAHSVPIAAQMPLSEDIGLQSS